MNNCYINRSMAKAALANMRSFYSELKDLYSQYDISLETDTGRRNMLMSSLQEKMFANEIKSLYPQATSDGKTGEPDIIIPELSRELECKLTSKNRSGSWQLQTDYNTLAAKGKLDYLYVLASRDFTEFAVLFFSDLTCDDFHPPASGSKGKSRMRLGKALKKCTVICGGVEDKSKVLLEKAELALQAASTPHQARSAVKRVHHWRNTSRVSFGLEAA